MNESDLELYGIVGRMLREIRESNGLPLEAGATYLNIAPKSLQRYECGERKIKARTIKELCNFYNISYDSFITEAKFRFGKNINEATYYSCPECGLSYMTDSIPDIEEHKRVHEAWSNASKKFGKLYCCHSENEAIKAKNRNIRNDLTRSIDERYDAEINVLRCLFSRSVDSSGFDLNHVSFNKYVSMMLNNEEYRRHLDKALQDRLIADYGVMDSIKGGESIYEVAKRMKSNKKDAKPSDIIMQYYAMLNDIGKCEATKMVMELAKMPQYTDGCHLAMEASAETAPVPMRFLAYYQKMASAGSGEFLFSDIPTDVIAVPDTPLSRRADFVIGVSGRSMEDTFLDGDRVLVRKTHEVSAGEIGIFVRGEECFIKEAGENRLISHNKDKKQYPDIVPDERGIEAVGLVLGRVGD